MYRLIIVDDEPVNFYSIHHVVDWQSYEIEICCTCTSGREAHEAILTHQPDFVITDIAMPDMSGLDLIASIRSLGFETEFIILTAYRNFTYACQALDNQALAYLLKPVKKEDIERVLPKLLDKLSQKNSVGIPTYDLNYSADNLSTPLKEYLTRAAVYPHNRVLLSDRPLTSAAKDAQIFQIPVRQFANACLFSGASPDVTDILPYGYSPSYPDFSGFHQMVLDAALSLNGEFPYAGHAGVASIQKFIASHYTEELGIPLLAEHFSMSESYLCNIFKKHTDTTIVNFIRHVRIHQAMRMIRFTNNDNITVSELAGYNSYSYFGKQFKEVTGMTPSQYRRENSLQEDHVCCHPRNP